jgi:hypothetical protein
MDAAYVGAQVCRMATQTPRPRAGDLVRQPLEIVTNSAEQLPLFVRDALRQSDAYPVPLSKHLNAACRSLLTFLNARMTPAARLRAGMPITAPPVEDDPAARILDC